MENTGVRQDFYLMQLILEALYSFSKNFDKLSNRMFCGMTAKQYRLIMAIQALPRDSATIVNIANALGTTKQNLNHMIPVLEKKGYISRRPNQNDSRAVNLEVTETGEDAMLEFSETFVILIRDIFDSLAVEELEALWGVLRKMRYCGSANCTDFVDSINVLFKEKYPAIVKRGE